MRVLPFLLAGLLASPVAVAHDYHRGGLHIDHPWSRPTPPGTGTGVGYLTITNNSDQAVTLIGATSPRAERVTIHQTTHHDGLMRMQPINRGLTIPVGQSVEFKPHSYHLMLEQLKEPLAEGESIHLVLDFDGADDMTVELKVESLDGGDAMDDHSSHGAEANHSGMKH
jgi:copper(I)-binding protein